MDSAAGLAGGTVGGSCGCPWGNCDVRDRLQPMRKDSGHNISFVSPCDEVRSALFQPIQSKRAGVKPLCPGKRLPLTLKKP
ncbi:hypothetical protein J6590_071914 [Homalodisca vitripennis]|nr:hypothetical protein J6590_071914 [Homalodisca vitripennis]